MFISYYNGNRGIDVKTGYFSQGIKTQNLTIPVYTFPHYKSRGSVRVIRRIIYILILCLWLSCILIPQIIRAEETSGKGVFHEGGFLKVACTEMVRTLDPQKAISQSEKWIIEHIFDGLFEYDINDKIIPVLAKDFPEKIGDHQYIIHLRPDILFHNGEVFDAQDVAFTFKRLLDPTTLCPTRSLFKHIISAEAISENMVRFVVGPDCPDLTDLLTRHEMYPLPMEAVKKQNEAFGNSIATGTGPFRLVEWDRANEVILEKNYSYKIMRPFLHRIFFLFPKVEKDFTKDLLYARVEMVPDISINKANQLSGVSGVKTEKRAGQRICQIYLNADRSPFDKRLIRRAVSLGIDREEIVNKAFRGFATQADSCLPPWHPFYESGTKSEYYDPNLTQSLLAFDGFRPDYPLSFSLMYSDMEPFKTIARLIQQQLARINIHVFLVPLPKNVLFDYIYGRRGKDRNQFQAALEDWEDWRGGGDVEQFTYRLYHHQSPENKLGNKQYEWETDLALALKECDTEKREHLIKQGIMAINSEIISIYLCFPHRIWAVRRWVNGQFCNSLGNLFLERVWVR